MLVHHLEWWAKSGKGEVDSGPWVFSLGHWGVLLKGGEGSVNGQWWSREGIVGGGRCWWVVCVLTSRGS